jgi:hypothetical protein
MAIPEIIAALQTELQRIDSAIAALERGSAKTKGRRGRHKISAAGRKRISDAMKKRWAERRKKAKAA